MKKTALALIWALVLAGLPLAALAADPPNFAFVPNMGASSVSKVDVILNVPVARYFTVPRAGQVLGAQMAAIFGVPAGPFPVAAGDWRASRIAMDPEGNAWVLNTGADCWLNGVPKYAFGIQGTVVRVQGDTTGLLNTSGGHNDVLNFGEDEAIQVYAVGGLNEVPRTVTFDLNGYLWVGFHMAAPLEWGYFQKYKYDKCAKTLTPVGSPVGGQACGYDIAPYNAAIDKNGVIWFSSYGSTRVGRFAGPYAAQHGMYSFNTNSPGAVTYYPGMTTAYGVLVDNTPPNPHIKVYATSLESIAPTNQMWIWDSTIGGSFLPVPVIGGSGMRSLGFDKYHRIWIASSNNGKVCWYNPYLGTSGSSNVVGVTPVGVGMDDAGDMWVIVRDSDKLITFTPPPLPSEPPADLGGWLDVAVGKQPYAYGDFTQVPPTYKICGYKYKAGTSPKMGLEGWTINLYKKEGGVFPVTPTATAVTDPSGHYCFTNLLAGVYKVTETLKPGWHQAYPATNEHIVTLPDSDPCAPENKEYNFENTPTICFDETAWAANAGPLTIRFLATGNWATYARYIVGDGTQAQPKQFKLFAGQWYWVGYLLVYDSGGYLYLKYDIHPEGHPLQHYKSGYCPDEGWEMTEYHFQVVDEFEDFNPFRNRNSQGQYGSPVPGRFQNNGIPVGGGWFKVDIRNYGYLPSSGCIRPDIFIAAHAAMKWCGYRCDWQY